MAQLHERIAEVQERIRQRSAASRTAYLDEIMMMRQSPDSNRQQISCSNMAHAAAGAGLDQANVLGMADELKPNIGIITAYNDMLSAHQPYEAYPQIIRAAARAAGATAQVAGGVPAMCDGVTQGRPGMELSLISRDVIAMATAVGLSHGVYDAAICLGVCDKIVPGLVMGALAFGHLPVIFAPAGPMATGIPNAEKAAMRKAFARGQASRNDLLKSEVAAYHGPGTCTFYGTANSNQMLMEIMGLHLPGAAFVHPHDDLRHALTVAATNRMVTLAKDTAAKGIGEMLDERSFVNAIIGLHATGGSTNHTLHLPAMAAAAGIQITWQDFADLSEVTPLLARVYPNGSADVNHFHAAGGIGYVMRQLIDAGLMDSTAASVTGNNINDHAAEPFLQSGHLIWRSAPIESGDETILRPVANPHSANGGLKMLSGNIGKAVIKVSAVAPKHHVITAPAAVFTTEAEVKVAYESGALKRDVIIVLRAQGPMANGMPELHSLTPLLSNLQDSGYQIALLTDGRMSGASGSIPAAIHVCPEAVDNGPIGKIMDGDMITLNAVKGTLEVTADLSSRTSMALPNMPLQRAFGRTLFTSMRQHAAIAEAGAGITLLETK